MTLSETSVISGPYTAIGNTGESFAITTPFSNDDHIYLLEDGVIQAQGTVYALTGAGTDDGGTATYDSSLNPTAGATITIVRIVPLDQNTDLRETGRFGAETVEDTLDRIVKQIQQSLQLDSSTANTFDAGTRRITDVVDPTGAQDAATKAYIDSQVLSAGSLPTPSDPADDDKGLRAGSGAWSISTLYEVPTATAVDQVVVATSTSAGGNTMATVPAAGGRAQNLLLNGSFQVAQHGTSFDSTTVPLNNNDVYLMDQWILLSEDATDGVDVAQKSTITPDGALNSIKLDAESANNKFGILQILEAEDTARAVQGGNGKVSLSFEAYLPAAASTLSALRVGVLGWTGTANAPTSSAVSAWNAAGVNPTLNGASWTTVGYLNTPANLTLVDDTWTTFTETDIDVSTAGIANLALFIWVDDDDVTIGDIVYIGNVQLVIGDRVDTYGHRPYAEELALCQRYLQVYAAGDADDPFCMGANTTDTTHSHFIMPFVSEMRTTPTLVVGSAATDFETFGADGADAASAVAISTATPAAATLAVTHTAVTAGVGLLLQAVNANAKLTFAAQLAMPLTGVALEEKKLELLGIIAQMGEASKHQQLKAHYEKTQEQGGWDGPYGWQVKFHNASKDNNERAIIAANRTGKTRTCAADVAIHTTGQYPPWWQGRKFNKATIWVVAGCTNEDVRNVQQKALLGTMIEGERRPDGSGWIPSDCIGTCTFRQCGVPNVCDTVRVKHTSGEYSFIMFKSYEQGAVKFQGFEAHGAWLDEEPPLHLDDIFSEVRTRIITTDGLLLFSRTPLFGMSRIVRHFMDGGPGVWWIGATWEDAPHLAESIRERYRLTYLDHEIDARMKGVPMMGTGAVYNVPDELIKHKPINIPDHWRRIVGIDFGIDHPFAAVWLAYDEQNDVVYVTDCYKRKGETAVYHAEAIKSRGRWIPAAWPHDGMQRDKGSGKPLAHQFREHGVNMLEMPAAWAAEVQERWSQKAQSREAGAMELLERMRTGRLYVFDHLHEWFEEKRLLYRDEGQIVAKDDDLESATRYAVMMLRFAVSDAAIEERLYNPKRFEQQNQDYSPLQRYNYSR